METLSWEAFWADPDRFLVVDVREPEAFRQGSLPGAVNLPLARLARGDYRLLADRPLLVVCERGQKSQLAALYLKADGFSPYVLLGGLSAIPAAVRKSLSIAL